MMETPRCFHLEINSTHILVTEIEIDKNKELIIIHSILTSQDSVASIHICNSVSISSNGLHFMLADRFTP